MKDCLICANTTLFCMFNYSNTSIRKKGLSITKKVYKKALETSEKGTTIILKRTLKERFVNNYNPEFILAWQANMDLQFCIDAYAIITYITDYLTKSDQGFEHLLKTALKENQTVPSLFSLEIQLIELRQSSKEEEKHKNTWPYKQWQCYKISSKWR